MQTGIFATHTAAIIQIIATAYGRSQILWQAQQPVLMRCNAHQSLIL